jgi:twitching motility protein PilT
MSGAKALLQPLGTRGITEITLVSGQVAYCNGGDVPRALDAVVHATDDILQILFEAGGSRHVDTLGARPSHWTTRIDGVGGVDVTATMHGEFVQARFALRPVKDSPTPMPGSGALGPAGMPLRPTPIAFVAPMPPSRPAPIPFAAPRPPPITAVKPAPPPAAPLRTAKPPALGSTEFSFDFALDDSSGRATPTPPTPPPPPSSRAAPPPSSRAAPPSSRAAPPPSSRAAPPPSSRAAPPPSKAVPPPPPARLPLDTPFADLSPFSAGLAQGVTPQGASAFKDLLLTARSLRASDLHLVAGRPPAYRIAGELANRGAPIDATRLAQMILPRVPPRLLASLESDGSADFALEEPGAGRFRVNVSRQRTGLKAAFRLIPNEIPTLESLGLPDAIGLATHHHQGLIVITGPTGHGKTTTLAAIVDILNRETARHVITVEDPVELVHPRKKAMMSQREVGTHTRSFQSALKASLREDPDVIVVGELRDTETVRMALAASETGHLVIGTMNTPSAAKTIDRLIDLFPPGDHAQVRMTLAGGLRLVVGQRLLPSADRTQLVAAAELLPGSLALWNLIRDSRTFQIPSLQQRGKGLGIIRLDDSLAALVQSNRTSLEAALAAAEAPAELEARLRSGKRPSSIPPARDSIPDEASHDRITSPPNPPPKQGLFERAGALLGKRGG